MKKEERKQLGYKNREWGAEAEKLAAEYFLKQGYLVREYNWKMNNLEIDLILEKDREMVFVEIKARKEAGQDPVDAVDRKKQLRMVRAADVYLQMQQFLYEYRFDIVTFIGTKDNYRMEHFPDAFLPLVNSGRNR